MQQIIINISNKSKSSALIKFLRQLEFIDSIKVTDKKKDDKWKKEFLKLGSWKIDENDIKLNNWNIQEF
jgi:hypothetical protein